MTCLPNATNSSIVDDVPEPALTLGIVLATTASRKLLSCDNAEDFLRLG